MDLWRRTWNQNLRETHLKWTMMILSRLVLSGTDTALHPASLALWEFQPHLQAPPGKGRRCPDPEAPSDRTPKSST